MSDALDQVLNKISLAFGNESVELIIPDNLLVELSLYKIAKIDTNDLEEELIFQSKVYMLFSTLLSYVTDKYNRVEAMIEQLESRLAFKYEKDLIARDDRVSDKKIEKLVSADDEMAEAVQQRLHYKNMVTTFANVLKGLEQRADMLIQLVSKRKREIEQRAV